MKKSYFSEDVQHLHAALQLADLNIDLGTAELVHRVSKLVTEKGGDGTMRDIAKLKVKWEEDMNQLYKREREDEKAEQELENTPDPQ